MKDHQDQKWVVRDSLILDNDERVLPVISFAVYDTKSENEPSNISVKIKTVVSHIPKYK